MNPYIWIPIFSMMITPLFVLAIVKLLRDKPYVEMKVGGIGLRFGDEKPSDTEAKKPIKRKPPPT